MTASYWFDLLSWTQGREINSNCNVLCLGPSFQTSVNCRRLLFSSRSHRTVFISANPSSFNQKHFDKVKIKSSFCLNLLFRSCCQSRLFFISGTQSDSYFHDQVCVESTCLSWFSFTLNSLSLFSPLNRLWIIISVFKYSRICLVGFFQLECLSVWNYSLRPEEASVGLFPILTSRLF